MLGNLPVSDGNRLIAGLYRICPVEDTLSRYLPLAKKFGITRLANVTGLDRIGLPVVIAIRPNARAIAVSQGKGPTLAHAKASAFMEAVEIWHAEHFDKPVFFARAQDLSKRRIFVDLDKLPLVRGRLRSLMERTLWTEAFDLISEQKMLVPFEMVHADYTHPPPPGSGCYPASTNGLASGNHKLEAICHGICEVVERDALAVWHHADTERQRASRIDLDTVDDALPCRALRMFKDAGLECAVWDVTSDIGIASFLCIINERGAAAGHLGLGSGTHPDRALALHRALSEAAQTRLNYISGAREDLSMDEYGTAGRAQKLDAFSDLLEASSPGRRYDRVQTWTDENLPANLEWLKLCLTRAGVDQIAVVDLTREEFGIPVVRVIIPGLEAPHDDESYVPGPRAQNAVEGGLTR